MTARYWNHRWIGVFVFVLALAAAGQWATASDLDRLDASLKLIPADAAFYSTMLRNREQVEAISRSNAWAKISEMPIVQMGVALYNQQLSNPDSKASQIEVVLKNPEMQKILDLLGDMTSDEVFVYGDRNFVDFVRLFQEVNTAQSLAPVVAAATGQIKGNQTERFQAQAVTSALVKNADLIGVPNLIFGFKLKNADLAKEELIKLEMFANVAFENMPKTKGHFKKTKIGNHEYLVLNLNGGMIPWDEQTVEKWKEMEAKDGDVQKVIDRMRKSTMVVALGVRDNYLLAMIGRSADCLEQLGKGERLIDRPEFKPLEKYVEKPLVSIGYASEALNRQTSNDRRNLDTLLQCVDRWLASADLSDKQKERIRKDAAALSQDVKHALPEPGAAMGWSFLTDRGFEGYSYVWGSHDRLDGAQPLGLLEYVGGNPLFGLVARQKVNAEEYETAVKWAKIAYGYFKDFGLPAMQKTEREKTEQFLVKAMPLVERLDKANRELLLPALADGQMAFVVDGKLTSKRFLESLPATEKAMPMFEPAVVAGVSDAKLLKKGLAEYRAILNGLIDAMRQIEGSDIPKNFEIPKPTVTEDSLGTIYSFTLPKDWGVDKQIEPNIAVNGKVAVVSTSREHARRLLKPTPLTIGGVLSKAAGPLAAAAWFDWAAMVEAASPWADFTVDQVAADKGIDETQKKPIADQVHTAMDVLKALRVVTSESYLDGGVLVNHALVEIQDVKK